MIVLLRAPALAADELSVFAAASLADALEEIAPAFIADTGHRPVFNLAGSNDLARQIAAGAPADVFFSADAAQMDLVEKAGRVRAVDRVELLSNTLAIVVPADSTLAVGQPSDLLAARRLALADPEAVPAGVYARAWLESQGLWVRLAPRVIPTLNVRAALHAVESGNADVAIVYRTDARLSRRARLAYNVPREQGPRIVYVVAPLADSPRTGSAAAFVRQLRSPESARVFERHGFLVPGAR